MIKLTVAVLIIISGCAVVAQRQSVTLQGLVRQHCNSGLNLVQQTQTRPLQGPRGPYGPKGSGGRRGKPGPAGPIGAPGLMNDSKLREIFGQSLDNVLHSMNMADHIVSKLEDCLDVSTKLSSIPGVKSGMFGLMHPEAGWINVYCDLDVDQGGWTVFQRRMDGSVDFYRGWDDYVYGFGNREGEFWLGLEKIYQMTNRGRHELRIDMVDDNGIQYYAKYSVFQLAPQSDNYRLTVTGYSGNATDALSDPPSDDYDHNKMPFSTKDADHDNLLINNCATLWKGAWWYNACLHSNLNGVYSNNVDAGGVAWRYIDTGGYLHLRFTEMKFR